MKNQISIKNTAVIIAIVLFVAFARIMPHMPNYSPLTALAIFGMFHFDKKWMAILVLFLATFLSDLVLNNTVYAYMFSGFTVFYEGFIWQYIAMALISVSSLYLLKKLSIQSVVLTSVISTILFFLVSNFGAFVSLPIYPKTMFGLSSAYLAGLPFLQATMISDVVYSSVLFGGFYFIQSRFAHKNSVLASN